MCQAFEMLGQNQFSHPLSLQSHLASFSEKSIRLNIAKHYLEKYEQICCVRASYKTSTSCKTPAEPIKNFSKMECDGTWGFTRRFQLENYFLIEIAVLQLRQTSKFNVVQRRCGNFWSSVLIKNYWRCHSAQYTKNCSFKIGVLSGVYLVFRMNLMF